jgi:DNA damage-inducible protein 1
MEGKDVDLLLGLDMLRRHQMCIDLRHNCLTVQDDRIPFLPESEIPKMFDEILENEPKIDGPEGTQIGARTGTVEQLDQQATATGPGPNSDNGDGAARRKINIHPPGSKNNIHTNPNAASSASTPPTRSEPPPSSTFGFGQPQRITKESIQKITDLGFTREEAIAALQQVNGDVELAIGLLL